MNSLRLRINLSRADPWPQARTLRPGPVVNIGGGEGSQWGETTSGNMVVYLMATGMHGQRCYVYAMVYFCNIEKGTLVLKRKAPRQWGLCSEVKCPFGIKWRAFIRASQLWFSLAVRNAVYCLLLALLKTSWRGWYVQYVGVLDVEYAPIVTLSLEGGHGNEYCSSFSEEGAK